MDIANATDQDFEIYAYGLCYASVCSSLGLEQTARRLNQEMPTGIASDWKLADGNFRTGQTNPCVCEKHGEPHMHYLFSC